MHELPLYLRLDYASDHSVSSCLWLPGGRQSVHIKLSLLQWQGVTFRFQQCGLWRHLPALLSSAWCLYVSQYSPVVLLCRSKSTKKSDGSGIKFYDIPYTHRNWKMTKTLLPSSIERNRTWTPCWKIFQLVSILYICENIFFEIVLSSSGELSCLNLQSY